jgi:hypothetical protein
MTSFHKFLVPLFALGAAVATPGLTGCMASGHAYVVEETPPPVRYERAVYRPGYVWVNGHWGRSGDRWTWRDGYYQRERPGFVYIDGRWQTSGRGHVWVDGAWRRRG